MTDFDSFDGLNFFECFNLFFDGFNRFNNDILLLSLLYSSCLHD